MFVPAPLTSAPISFRKLAKSTISGSSAAFSIIVVPSASTAAIIIFSVAPTDGKSKYNLDPTNLSALASTKPWSITISAPKALNPFKCRSIGLVPIEHPPGIDIFVWLNLASNGPITKNDALIFLTSSYGASQVVKLLASTVNVLSLYSTSAPRCLIKSEITCTSVKSGTSCKTDFPFTNNVAAIIGNTAFFAPSILTFPLSGLLFFTIILAINMSLLNLIIYFLIIYLYNRCSDIYHCFIIIFAIPNSYVQVNFSI